MPLLSAVRTANATFKPLYTPIAIFVGGTSGIGQGMAEGFAEHIHGKVHIIIIVVRNRGAAQNILAHLPKPKGEDYTQEFVPCDVSRMKNIESLTPRPPPASSKAKLPVYEPRFLNIEGH